MRSRPRARLRFAARLRTTREAKYSTQKEFADACGFQPETYRMWERGDREPNISNLGKIATALDVSLDYLIVGKTPKLGSIEDPGAISDPDIWRWETDEKYRLITGQHTNVAPFLIGKERREYGINPTISWATIDFIMDNRQPIVDLKFQHMALGYPKAVCIRGAPVYDPKGEFLGYRGAGRTLMGDELKDYLRGVGFSPAQRVR